jgi:PTS system cellobiose-specific IIB component
MEVGYCMNIMLTCAQGVSTSLLVSKMQKAAKEQGKDYKIWAIDYLSVDKENENYDVLLLGPQVRHMLSQFKKKYGGKAKVDVIRPVDYGRCDGAAVLEYAEKLYEGEV